MALNIPHGFQICYGCNGAGEVYCRTVDSGSWYEPPTDIFQVCEVCDGDEIIPIDDENDAPEHTDADEPFWSDADDISEVLASAGFGTDEDYGGAAADF